MRKEQFVHVFGGREKGSGVRAVKILSIFIVIGGSFNGVHLYPFLQYMNVAHPMNTLNMTLEIVSSWLSFDDEVDHGLSRKNWYYREDRTKRETIVWDGSRQNL